MKHFLLTIFSAFIVLQSSAQAQTTDSLQQRFLEAKVQEIAERLKFNDEQKAQFTPIYQRYTEAMIATWEGYQSTEHPSTSQEAANNIRTNLQLQQRSLDIRLRFIDEFAAVLTPQQMSRLFSLDNMVQRKVNAAKRRTHSHAPHPARKAPSNKRPAWQSQPPAAKPVSRIIGKNSHQRQRTFNAVRLPKEPHVHKHEAGNAESAHSH